MRLSEQTDGGERQTHRAKEATCQEPQQRSREAGGPPRVRRRLIDDDRVASTSQWLKSTVFHYSPSFGCICRSGLLRCCDTNADSRSIVVMTDSRDRSKSPYRPDQRDSAERVVSILGLAAARCISDRGDDAMWLSAYLRRRLRSGDGTGCFRHPGVARCFERERWCSATEFASHLRANQL